MISLRKLSTSFSCVAYAKVPFVNFDNDFSNSYGVSKESTLTSTFKEVNKVIISNILSLSKEIGDDEMSIISLFIVLLEIMHSRHTLILLVSEKLQRELGFP